MPLATLHATPIALYSFSLFWILSYFTRALANPFRDICIMAFFWLASNVLEEIDRNRTEMKNLPCFASHYFLFVPQMK